MVVIQEESMTSSLSSLSEEVKALQLWMLKSKDATDSVLLLSWIS